MLFRSQRDPGTPHSSDRGGQDDGGGALDVVVEGADLLGVMLQDVVGVGDAEVLSVDHRVGEQLGDHPHETVDELVVLLATDPGVTLPQVAVAVQQPQVVGADVQDDGNGALRVDARGGAFRLL